PVGVAESWQVDGNDPPDCSDVVPYATEGPKAFGPWRQQKHSDIRVCLGIGEPDSHPVADSEVGSDRRNRLGAHLTVASLQSLRRLFTREDRRGRLSPTRLQIL